MKRILKTLILLVSALVLSCSLTNQAKNPIFSGTTFIDGCSPTGTTNAVFPDIKWNSPGSSVSYEIAAVFNAPITVSGKQISNTNSCIAMWTSGMTGSAGSVNFSNFKKVTNGVLLSTVAVDGSTFTNAGSATYYWAVWAYSSEMEITYSSGQNQLVKN